MSRYTALIDGDVLVYTIGHSSQKKLPDGVTLEVEPFEFAVRKLKLLIHSILAQCNTRSYCIYLTLGKTSFRRDLMHFIHYKGQRKEDSKPVHYQALREHIACTYAHQWVDILEADDALGTSICSKYTGTGIICTIDKDLDMIPGNHFNFRTGEHYITSDRSKLQVSENGRKLYGGGILWLYCQLLLGDISDNITGIKGIGPKNCWKLLQDVETEERAFRLVTRLYEEEYPEDGRARFDEAVDLLYIHRSPQDLTTPYSLQLRRRY